MDQLYLVAVWEQKGGMTISSINLQWYLYNFYSVPPPDPSSHFHHK